MKILIIYEEIPEATKFYSVEVTRDEWKWIRRTHGHFVNTVHTDENPVAFAACNALSNWLVGEKPLERRAAQVREELIRKREKRL